MARAPLPAFWLGRHLGLPWNALFRVFQGEGSYDTELARVPPARALARILTGPGTA
jgi:hypothetical protein